MNYGHIIDFLNENYWAITPEALENMHQILALRLHDGKISVEEMEAKIGDDKDRPNAPYMMGKTAVIPIYGPIAKKMNLFTAISGGTSAELLQRDIQAAMEDKKVDSLLFDIDSPGGSVDGPFDVADTIHSYRGTKPMRAYANGQMTSAAYLIGSAADEVFATNTARVGSIGVITAHYDYSKAQEMQGVKKTYLYSGKYKAMGHDSEPLTDEARDYIQGQLDHFYTMFVDQVAKNRGVDTKEVLAKMADGKIFIGEQAIAKGVIDRVCGFKEASTFEMCNTTNKRKEVKLMDPVMEFRKEHPEAYLELTEKTKQKAATEMKEHMQAKIDEKDKMIEDLKSENENLLSSLDDSAKRLLELEKKETMRSEREMKKDADRICSDELAASDVPARLHPKVAKMVSHEKFIKDGVFDRDGFREAIQAEMKDWEGVGADTVIGGAAPIPGAEDGLTDANAVQEEVDATVDEMLEMAEPPTQH